MKTWINRETHQHRMLKPGVWVVMGFELWTSLPVGQCSRAWATLPAKTGCGSMERGVPSSGSHPLHHTHMHTHAHIHTCTHTLEWINTFWYSWIIYSNKNAQITTSHNIMDESHKLKWIWTQNQKRGEGDKGEWWRGEFNYDTNVTMYPQYNNNILMKKINTKSHILHDSSYIKFKSRENIFWWIPREWWWGSWRTSVS
jgi:hypothetical protein